MKVLRTSRCRRPRESSQQGISSPQSTQVYKFIDAPTKTTGLQIAVNGSQGKGAAIQTVSSKIA